MGLVGGLVNIVKFYLVDFRLGYGVSDIPVDFYNFIGITFRYHPYPLFSISDDPADQYMTRRTEKAQYCKSLNNRAKLQFIGHARLFSSMFPQRCTPEFVDEVVSMCFPNYIISGTHMAHINACALRDELSSHAPVKEAPVMSLLASFTGALIDGGVTQRSGSYTKRIAEQLAITHTEATFLYKLSTLIAMHAGQEQMVYLLASLVDSIFGSVDPSTGLMPWLYTHILHPYARVKAGTPALMQWMLHHFVSNHVVRSGSDPQKQHYSTKCHCDFANSTCVDAEGNLSNYNHQIKLDLAGLWNTHWVGVDVLNHMPPSVVRQLLKWLWTTPQRFDSFSPTLLAGSVMLTEHPVPAQATHAQQGVNTAHPLIPQYSIKFVGKITRAQVTCLDRLFPCSSEIDKKHMLTRLSALVAVIAKKSWRTTLTEVDPDLAKQARTHISNGDIANFLSDWKFGTPQNVMITVLLATVGKPQHEYEFYRQLQTLGFTRQLPSVQIEMLKTCSTMLRRYNMAPNGKYVSDAFARKCAYWELSFGRSEFVSDVNTEIKNRTTRPYHLHVPKDFSHSANLADQWRDDATAFVDSDPNFYIMLKEKVSTILATCLQKKPARKNYHDFLKTANDWLASGSAPGATVEIPGAKGPISVGKRGWAESIDMYKLSREIYDTKPIEAAVASEKFENGKGRALYGVEQKHYMHSTYATKGLEERLWLVDGLEKGMSGAAQLQGELKRANITANRQQHCMMVDYADFNIQHTMQAQAIIFEELASLGRQRGAAYDWIAANQWIARAKYNMWARFHVTDSQNRTSAKNMHVVQGMFSGTRCTDLINTVLNLAYYQVAETLVREKFGIDAEELYHVHQGDDVWISASNPEWCALIYYTLNQMGLVMRNHKQMFGQGRGEFLRVLYSHGKARGYMGRALANLLLKEVQKPLPLDTASNLRSVDVSLSALARRGLSGVALCILHHDLINHLRKVKEFPGDPHPITVPLSVVYAPQQAGGIGISKPFYVGDAITLKRCSKQAATFPNVPAYDGPVLSALPSKCTSNWVAQVHEKLKHVGDISAQTLHNASVKNNFADALHDVFKRSQMRKYKKQVSSHLMQMQGVTSNCSDHDISIDVPLSRPSTHSGAHIGNLVLAEKAEKHELAFADCNQMVRYISDLARQQYSKMDAQDITRKGHLRETAVGLLKRLIVRSELKSVSKLRSALALTENQALQLILASTGDISKAQSWEIRPFQKLVSLNIPGVAALTLDHAIGSLGALEYKMQPSICLAMSELSTALVTKVLNTTPALARDMGTMYTSIDVLTTAALRAIVLSGRKHLNVIRY